ncbi:MAG: rRNA maturation RNase YbeY [Pseudomonadales bacterium]
MPVEVQVASAVQIASALDEIPQAREIQIWADTALEEVVDGEPPDLCIRVVDSEESLALNARFRGVDEPTNVLSFPAQVDLPGENIYGDVVICASVVCSEAADQGKSVCDHYAHMVVHGVLHLAGYDHEHNKDAELMEALEIKILERVGVADPYAER